MHAIPRNIPVIPPPDTQKNYVRPFFQTHSRTIIPRLKLYGKKATEEQICKEIANLLLGQSPHQPHQPRPLTKMQVCKALGFDKKTVRKYTKIAAQKYGFLKIDSKGKVIEPHIMRNIEFRRFEKNHRIVSDPLVSEWRQDLLTRKGGEPLVTWKTRIRNLEVLCNTCKINPSQLLFSQKQTEKILKNYAELYRQGRHDRVNSGLRSHPDAKSTIYHRVQAARDFCSYYGMTWKRGINGIMSQKTIGHGKYADIRLSEDELEQADQFIKQRWGLDSDIYRWFWVGIESCARFEALYGMNLDYTVHTSKNGKITFIMTAYESKTKQVRGGKWYKYITRQDTQSSLELIKSENNTKIHKTYTAKYIFRKAIREMLSEIYRFLGKTNPYFYSHPTHALRHIGAHYWLSKKDYNYGLVAEIGGWHTIDELKKSYRQIPPERILELIEN